MKVECLELVCGYLEGNECLPDYDESLAIDEMRNNFRALLKAAKALKEIAEYPNSEGCHDHVCLLHEDEDAEFCTCGYWSSCFPQLKSIARQALSNLEGGNELSDRDALPKV